MTKWSEIELENLKLELKLFYFLCKISLVITSAFSNATGKVLEH